MDNAELYNSAEVTVELSEKSIRSLNRSYRAIDPKKLSRVQIAIMLGGERDEDSDEVVGDNNWICNFH